MSEQFEDFKVRFQKVWRAKLEQLKEHRDELVSNADSDVINELVIDCIDDIIELLEMIA